MNGTSRVSCALLVVIIHFPLMSQWQQTNGPAGETDIYDFHVMGNRVFVGTSVGPFLSTDGGMSWHSFNAGGVADYSPARRFTRIDSVLYGILDNDVYQSSDSGTTWILPAPSPYSATYTIGSLGSSLFAMVEPNNYVEISRSTNGGTTWELVYNTGSYWEYPAGDVLVAKGNDIFAASHDGIVRSTDMGLTWSPADTLDSGSLFRAAQSMTVLGDYLIGGTHISIRRSSDDGNRWSTLDTLPGYSFLVRDSLLFAATGTGVSVSADSGLTWQALNNGLSGKVVAVDGNDQTLLAGTVGKGGTVYRSTDDGASWQKSANGIIAGNITALAARGNRIVAAVKSQGISISADSGQTWTIANQLMERETYQLYVDSGNVYAATDSGHVYVSTDQGDSWSHIGIPSTDEAVHALVRTSGDSTILAGTNGVGVWRSTNLGMTWNPASSGLPSMTVNAFARMDSLVFAGVTDGGVYMSTNDGETWGSTGNSSSLYSIMALAVVGDTIWSGEVGSGGQFRGVRRSSNRGVTWLNGRGGDISGKEVQAILAVGTEIAASTGNPLIPASGAVYRSTDGGVTFVADTVNLRTRYATALAATGNTLYAGTPGYGVWRRHVSTGPTTAVEGPPELPASFALEQNYPNPFNPTTTVVYRLPSAVHVHLVVFDLLGREVARLVNELQQAGEYRAAFDASSLPSGIYFYRMTAGSVVQSKRMVLVR